jgi:hypothetical protein
MQYFPGLGNMHQDYRGYRHKGHVEWRLPLLRAHLQKVAQAITRCLTRYDERALATGTYMSKSPRAHHLQVLDRCHHGSRVFIYLSA